MDIRPIITGSPDGNTGTHMAISATMTNNMAQMDMKTKSIFKPSRTLDPLKVIPNGIYKVFKSEITIKTINISLLSVVFFLSFIFCLLFAFSPTSFSQLLKDPSSSVPWGWYIIPVVLGVISIVVLTFESIELSGIKKSILHYRERIAEGESFTPPFVAILYEKLMKKQVRRTWLVVAILFYLGLFTLIFWALKDKSWKALKFQEWIHNSFVNPDLVVYILCGILIGVVVLFIVNSIYRKKRMVDIQNFFGQEVMNYADLLKERSNAHKYWAKVFFISVLVILVIPIITLLIVKKFVKKGK
ncbi:hypothetical protein OF364_02475 [Mycoplasma enhydrae]|uniref:MSC_0882 family membrane protein n=1 Tax=Mycoplasma enhydrae TaxID=2499220 RepID=UPI00197B7A48|nr:hypothetical protein [Mycoplasma enhydrae]MBN4089232.1 hypothetical protein [Mycoplasma enhydrae]MCV3733608.1 hypothetical protein [Mycoplasma enhydrae]MCV3753676.1 hypothetical protein [Mycoplasma enhydrae]